MFAPIDAAFASIPRPEKFSNDPVADRFFRTHTIESLGALQEAFLYFFPAIARMMHNGDKTGLLMPTEYRRDLFTQPRRAAIERLSSELGA